VLSKVVLALSPHLAAHHVAKFHEATPFGSKVLASNTLHFKPIFDHPLKKIVRGPLTIFFKGGSQMGLNCNELAIITLKPKRVA